MKETKDFPLKLKEVFERLVAGYHLSIDDELAHRDISDNYDYYRSLFNELGYELSGGDDGLYYFINKEKKINDPSKKYLAFMAIMYDWLADQGKDPITSLIEEHFYLNKLPHLVNEQYKKIMKELDIDDHKKLLNLVNGLKRYGFIKQTTDSDFIKFRKPVRRFEEILADLAIEADKAKIKRYE